MVSGQINGCPYRKRLISRGGGRQIMAIDQALRDALGMCGNSLHAHFTMEADTISAPSLLEEFRMPKSATDALSAITTRRSIRNYLRCIVGEEVISAMLNAAFYAPSAKNKRPWHFVVIKGPANAGRHRFSSRDTGMAEQAGVCIAVCADKNLQGIPELLYADCAAATQNMLLCAHALGLGAVWCGVTSGFGLFKILTGKLDLPARLQPFAIIAAGVPDERPEPVPRYVRQKIHTEKW